MTSGQAASLVLGQPGFESSAANAGGLGAASLRYPWGLASDGIRLWVADEVNGRVLQWNAVPTANQTPADVVIGQASMTSSGSALTRTGLRAQAAMNVATDGFRVIVSDAGSNRVLVWNSAPTTDGAEADLVLGQPAFDRMSPGDAAHHMMVPKGAWTDGTRLAVADSGNSRVLIWSAFPAANGAPADVVLGWSGFDRGRFDPPAAPPTAASLKRPQGVHFDGERFYVADTGNHRILVWYGFPVVTGQPADLVLGRRRLSEPVRQALVAPANEVYLSSVSAWEIGVKHALGRLPLPEPAERYIPAQRQARGIEPCPLDEEAALYLHRLPTLSAIHSTGC